MDAFFTDVFKAFPPTSPRWKVYKQHGIKVAILFKNTTGKPRDMPEIRSGHDGKTELVDGRPHVLAAGESRWIAIEPSNKSFMYDDSGLYGAAAYPKTLEDAKAHWKPLKKGADVQKAYAAVKRAGCAIPFYQIAATLASLYPHLADEVCSLKMKALLEVGSSNLGFPGIIKIFQSKATVLGCRIGRSKQDKAFVAKHPVYPMGYRDVPIESGSLLIVDLNDKRPHQLAKGTVKYRTPAGKVAITGVMARIIDAPAVKGAMWKPVATPPKVRVPALLTTAQSLLTHSANFRAA